MILMNASKTSKWCKRSNILGHLSHTGFIAQCLIGEGNEVWDRPDSKAAKVE